ncbi:unnamed protein product, partial [Prorocentrum cordatum]
DVGQFADRAIDFYWMDARLASIFEDVHSNENMPYRPRRPTWIRVALPWHAYVAQVIERPRPEFDLDHGAAEGLDCSWQGFCKAAEAELRALFGWAHAEARGRGGRRATPEVVKRQLPPKQPSPIADPGPARAWRWAARELAWINQLVCGLLRGEPKPRDGSLRGVPEQPSPERLDIHSDAGGRPTTSGGAPLRGYIVEVSQQLRRAWRRLLLARHHRGQMDPWGALLFAALQALAAGDRAAPIAEAIFRIQRFAEGRAQAWEQHVTRQRSAKLHERLGDKFPGSGGYLHEICHWKYAWKEPIFGPQ